MKRALLIFAAAASTLAATGASAQPFAYGGRDYDRSDRYDRYDRDDRGYRGDRRWGRGQYLPPAYRGRGYVVSDYHRYRLRQPPRGYYWYRTGNDYVLAAIATGLILEVFNGGYDYRGGYGRRW